MKFPNTAKNLRHARQSEGLSQNELAATCKITGQVISNAERGAAGIPPRLIKSIAKTLKIDPFRLVHWATNDYAENYLRKAKLT